MQKSSGAYHGRETRPGERLLQKSLVGQLVIKDHLQEATTCQQKIKNVYSPYSPLFSRSPLLVPSTPLRLSLPPSAVGRGALVDLPCEIRSPVFEITHTRLPSGIMSSVSTREGKFQEIEREVT